MTGFQSQIDLGKNGAKWKHGWIPLNAEAVAILNAKAEHGHTLSHEQLHAMKLSDLKKHYSETIKAHGFQHVYTKKVGKAVGSHPESLALTKAKADAKKAGTAAPEPPKAAPAAPPKIEGPEPPPAVTDPFPAGAPEGTQPVKSVTGEHIGYAIPNKGDQYPGKKWLVLDKHGQTKAGVNSFTGAQLALGEKQVGKPAAMEPVGPPKEPDVVLPEKKPHEHVGAKVGSTKQLEDAPTGTLITAHGSPWVKLHDGHWQSKEDPTMKLSNGNFSGSINGDNVSWAGKGEPTPLDAPTLAVKPGFKAEPFSDGVWSIQSEDGFPIGTVIGSEDGKEHVAMVPDPEDDLDQIELSTHPTAEAAAAAVIEHHAPTVPEAKKEKPKPIKVEPDPEPPKHPGAGTEGWSVNSTAELDAAPAGTWVSQPYAAYLKNAEGTWDRYHKQGDHWSKLNSSYYENTPSSSIVGKGGPTITPWVWGDKGPNTEAPAGYTGPKYGIQEKHGKWAVVNHYNGTIEDVKTGKPNASKKANDLNITAGTLTANQKKQKAKMAMKQASYQVSGLKPSDLNHPTVPVGAKVADLVDKRFDGSKAGKLGAAPQPDATLTSNHELFGQWQGNGSTAKQNVARQIGARMAHHDGYDKQEKLDAAWKALVSVKAAPTGDASSPVPNAFQGEVDDAYSADPQFGPGGTFSKKRGTEEYRSIMREQMVGKMVQWWAQSSNDDHAVTLTLQELAAEHFGMEDVAGWNSASEATKAQIKMLKQDPAFRDLATSFLQSQYDTAQSALAAKGITHLTIRRGTKAGVSSTWKAGETGPAQMRPMSSWSTNHGTAVGFSGGKYVLETTVPREKVIGFAGHGFGCLGEYEVVVLGGQTQVKLHSRNGSTA